jgi:hypothetical protein
MARIPHFRIIPCIQLWKQHHTTIHKFISSFIFLSPHELCLHTNGAITLEGSTTTRWEFEALISHPSPLFHFFPFYSLYGRCSMGHPSHLAGCDGIGVPSPHPRRGWREDAAPIGSGVLPIVCREWCPADTTDVGSGILPTIRMHMLPTPLTSPF